MCEHAYACTPFKQREQLRCCSHTLHTNAFVRRLWRVHSGVCCVLSYLNVDSQVGCDTTEHGEQRAHHPSHDDEWSGRNSSVTRSPTAEEKQAAAEAGATRLTMEPRQRAKGAEEERAKCDLRLDVAAAGTHVELPDTADKKRKANGQAKLIGLLHLPNSIKHVYTVAVVMLAHLIACAAGSRIVFFFFFLSLNHA